MGAGRTQLHQTQEMTLDKVLGMAKGDGEESYHKNSGLQAVMNKMSLSALNDALERVTLPSEAGSSVVVADLGSSSGPNTINNVALIMEKLRHRVTGKEVEFQAYFNDLPSNDFNNLFQLLTNDSRANNWYAAGVPGSFFHRLFAQSSVHVFFSSISLQYVSKIPDAVLDKDSSAYNKGSSWILHSRSAVAKAYQQQASEDLKNFLLARAAELVSAGLLFFVFVGRSTSEPNEPTNCSVNDMSIYTDEVWSDLVEEGLATEHDKDTFNIPLYLRSIEEVREAIASCSSLFHVITAETQPIAVSCSNLYGTSDATALSRKIGAQFKALFNDILELKIGKEASAVFWQRLDKSFERGIRKSTEESKFLGQLHIVSLIRNRGNFHKSRKSYNIDPVHPLLFLPIAVYIIICPRHVGTNEKGKKGLLLEFRFLSYILNHVIHLRISMCSQYASMSYTLCNDDVVEG